jgi:hypothetical protein
MLLGIDASPGKSQTAWDDVALKGMRDLTIVPSRGGASTSDGSVGGVFRFGFHDSGARDSSMV